VAAPRAITPAAHYLFQNLRHQSAIAGDVGDENGIELSPDREGAVFGLLTRTALLFRKSFPRKLRQIEFGFAFYRGGIIKPRDGRERNRPCRLVASGASTALTRRPRDEDIRVNAVDQDIIKDFFHGPAVETPGSARATPGRSSAVGEEKSCNFSGVHLMLLSREDRIHELRRCDVFVETTASNLNLTTCTTGANDPPVGATILCWHTGRMFAAGFSGIGGGAVPRDTIAVSNLLAFGNGQWNLTTRSFRVGDGDGDPIIALYSMQDSNLAVFKANSVWLVNTPASADASGFGATTDVESVAFGVGCVGKRALCGVANDIFFMAQDGVRSLQRMQAAAGQWQLSAPISQPVQKYIEQINPAAQSGIVATSYKEFVFFAVPLGTSMVNNAVLVYNTRLGSWLGCWQNWTPSAWTVSRFNSVQQLLFGDSNGYVNYWKDAQSVTEPSTYTDNGVNISTTIWTRSFQFLQAVNDKFPYNCTLRFTAGNSVVSLAAVADLAQALAWQSQLQPQGDILGQHKLGPFQLATVKPAKVEKSLRSIPAFNEMYLSISTSSGYMQLRNVTVAAFLKALDN
jgi:hypothetical protein